MYGSVTAFGSAALRRRVGRAGFEAPGYCGNRRPCKSRVHRAGSRRGFERTATRLDGGYRRSGHHGLPLPSPQARTCPTKCFASRKPKLVYLPSATLESVGREHHAVLGARSRVLA